MLVDAVEEHPRSISTERIVAFLTTLEGPWEGKATTTPIGPRPYNSTFKRASPERLEGEAHPGDSVIHYWTFYREDQILKLRFLSTFRGNQQPLFLTATEEKDEAIIFHTQRADFLEVRVKPSPQKVTIQIFLRGKPHVEILLTREL
jgi:hypothetical protein